MKALGILKRISEKHESAYSFNGEMVVAYFEINEAIAELEALQNEICSLKIQLNLAESTNDMLTKGIEALQAPKTCDGCKDNDKCTLKKDMERLGYEMQCFFCSYYKPKETPC